MATSVGNFRGQGDFTYCCFGEYRQKSTVHMTCHGQGRQLPESAKAPKPSGKKFYGSFSPTPISLVISAGKPLSTRYM
jgi:hypothetical protein